MFGRSKKAAGSPQDSRANDGYVKPLQSESQSESGSTSDLSADTRPVATAAEQPAREPAKTAPVETAQPVDASESAEPEKGSRPGQTEKTAKAEKGDSGERPEQVEKPAKAEPKAALAPERAARLKKKQPAEFADEDATAAWGGAPATATAGVGAAAAVAGTGTHDQVSEDTGSARGIEPATTGLPSVERTEDAVPGPNDDSKPDKPKDLQKGSFRYALKRAFGEFGEDKCTDVAASLTYYSVLSIFPAVIALMSILGVIGQQSVVDKVLEVVKPLVSGGTYDTVSKTLNQLSTTQGAGIALIIGVLAALWSASGYVGAFGRAMNRVYEVQEGRAVWKLRPLQMFITVLTLLLCVLGMVILVVSGPVARSIGDVLGLGSTAVTVWDIAKWPVLALIVIGIVALLYHSTPNVKQPKFRWLSGGAFLAILVWVLASMGFAFYVANFSSYNKTYGSLAGVVVFLLWLWITNMALLFGAELDSELERARQLQAGMPAEEAIQLPVRDHKGIEKAEAKREKSLARARELRGAAGTGDPADRPFTREARNKRR